MCVVFVGLLEFDICGNGKGLEKIGMKQESFVKNKANVVVNRV